jgi:hypothetical protein
MAVQYDIGYLQPRGLQPVPIAQPSLAVPVSQKNQDWLDKVGNVVGKIFTGLYTGAMGALDIYGRYKAIERGQEPILANQPEKPQPIVIMGQEIPRQYVLIGLILLLIVGLLLVFRSLK